jgi:hypothetical protein
LLWGQINFILTSNVDVCSFCILCLSCNVKTSPKQLPNFMKTAEITVILIVFNGVLHHVHTCTVSYLSFHLFSWIRYQKTYIKDRTPVYNKIYSPGHCNLTAQIHVVHDKYVRYMICIYMQGFQYFSHVPVLHYSNTGWTIFMNILYNTL